MEKSTAGRKMDIYDTMSSVSWGPTICFIMVLEKMETECRSHLHKTRVHLYHHSAGVRRKASRSSLSLLFGMMGSISFKSPQRDRVEENLDRKFYHNRVSSLDWEIAPLSNAVDTSLMMTNLKMSESLVYIRARVFLKTKNAVYSKSHHFFQSERSFLNDLNPKSSIDQYLFCRLWEAAATLIPSNHVHRFPATLSPKAM